MSSLRRTTLATMLLLLTASVAAAGDLGWSQPQPPQEEFVPLDQVPPEDQLPAAPLLIAAYAIVWVVVFGYLWSIWRRQAAVEQDLRELSRRRDTEA